MDTHGDPGVSIFADLATSVEEDRLRAMGLYSYADTLDDGTRVRRKIAHIGRKRMSRVESMRKLRCTGYTLQVPSESIKWQYYTEKLSHCAWADPMAHNYIATNDREVEGLKEKRQPRSICAPSSKQRKRQKMFRKASEMFGKASGPKRVPRIQIKMPAELVNAELSYRSYVRKAREDHGLRLGGKRPHEVPAWVFGPPKRVRRHEPEEQDDQGNAREFRKKAMSSGLEARFRITCKRMAAEADAFATKKDGNIGVVTSSQSTANNGLSIAGRHQHSAPSSVVTGQSTQPAPVSPVAIIKDTEMLDAPGLPTGRQRCSLSRRVEHLRPPAATTLRKLPHRASPDHRVTRSNRKVRLCNPAMALVADSSRPHLSAPRVHRESLLRRHRHHRASRPASPPESNRQQPIQLSHKQVDRIACLRNQAAHKSQAVPPLRLQRRSTQVLPKAFPLFLAWESYQHLPARPQMALLVPATKSPHQRLLRATHTGIWPFPQRHQSPSTMCARIRRPRGRRRWKTHRRTRRTRL